MRNVMRVALCLIALAGWLACGARQAPAQTADSAASTMVPPGHGTLRRDDITLSVRNGPLLIQVTPLNEGIIRLLAPDMYNRMHSVAESKRRESGSAAEGNEPELFLVSFFSYQPDVEYQPEDFQLSHQGRLLSPLSVLPVTNGFGRQRLKQQESQSAVYVFSEKIDYNQRLVIRYGTAQTDAWSQIIPRLEIERARVRAKAG